MKRRNPFSSILRTLFGIKTPPAKDELTEDPVIDDPYLGQIDECMKYIHEKLGSSYDLGVRHMTLGGKKPLHVVVVFIDGLIDKKTLEQHVLKPLMGEEGQELSSRLVEEGVRKKAEVIFDSLLSITTGKVESKWPDILKKLLAGHTILFIAGSDSALSMHFPGFQFRALSSPESEPVIVGPKDGFTEALNVNTSLIRRRIRDEDLRLEGTEIGTRTSTDVVIVYIEGLANPRILSEVRTRLHRVNADRLLDSNQLAAFIEDSKWSPLPQILRTEKPDVVCLHLLEGRVAILCDNSPTALIVPVTIRNFMISPEDYYLRWYIASFTRTIRVIAIFSALLFPALYIALTSFNPELLPVKLMISIGASRLSVPFPSILEALLLTISLELLTEAASRLPNVLGTTVGVVGGLIIGQAAVTAGLVSAGMVIVISITAIGTFVLPKIEFAQSIRYLRFTMIFAAWGWGLYGLALAITLLVAHICELRCFGVPYSSPVAPLYLSELNDDLFARLPLPDNKYRSITGKPKDRVKVGDVDGGQANG